MNFIRKFLQQNVIITNIFANLADIIKNWAHNCSIITAKHHTKWQ